MRTLDRPSIRRIVSSPLFALLLIIALGAYFRLFNILHLFNSVYSSDEGVYTVGSRFISEGLMPYRDFTLAHPPLYSLVLAAIFKVFGYNFFLAKYFSVALSLLSIVFIYLSGKKLFNTTTGIVAALLFAITPEMVYLGRRTVQEPLGIFLVILGIYFAIQFVGNRKMLNLFWSGLCLGLAVATKYTFLPDLCAIALAVHLLSLENSPWKAISHLGKSSFWLKYLGFTAGTLSVLFMLKYGADLNIPIPLLDTLPYSITSVLVLIWLFVVPFSASALLTGEPSHLKKWFATVLNFKSLKPAALLILGALIGFFSITAYFLLKTPAAFIHQTITMQGKGGSIFPSLSIAVVDALSSTLSSGTFSKLAFLIPLSTIPLAIFLLRERDLNPSRVFIIVSLLFGILLCQFLPPEPRYYLSLLPFFILGIASLVQHLDIKALNAKWQDIKPVLHGQNIVVGGLIILFLSVSILVLVKYPGYDVGQGIYATDEGSVYSDTVSYLEQIGAKKVYAPDPIFNALSTKFEASTLVDTYALVFLTSDDLDQAIKNQIAQGVDYIIVDNWVTYNQDPRMLALLQAIRQNARLVRIVGTGSSVATQIYSTNASKEGVYNGNLSGWASADGVSAPIGWLPVEKITGGDSGGLSSSVVQGVGCASIFVDKQPDQSAADSSTYVSLLQSVPFTTGSIEISMLIDRATQLSDEAVEGPYIRLSDGAGHEIDVGFSDQVDTDGMVLESNSSKMVLLKKAQLGQWGDYDIDVASLWAQTGWQTPANILMYLTLTADNNLAGHLSFDISRVTVK